MRFRGRPDVPSDRGARERGSATAEGGSRQYEETGSGSAARGWTVRETAARSIALANSRMLTRTATERGDKRQSGKPTARHMLTAGIFSAPRSGRQVISNAVDPEKAELYFVRSSGNGRLRRGLTRGAEESFDQLVARRPRREGSPLATRRAPDGCRCIRFATVPPPSWVSTQADGNESRARRCFHCRRPAIARGRLRDHAERRRRGRSRRVSPIRSAAFKASQAGSRLRRPCSSGGRPPTCSLKPAACRLEQQRPDGRTPRH